MAGGYGKVEWRRHKGFEGGSVYVGEARGQFLVLVDSGTLVSMLPEDDRAGMVARRIKAFETDDERKQYLDSRYPLRGD